MKQIKELMKDHADGLMTNQEFWAKMVELSENKYSAASHNWDEDANT